MINESEIKNGIFHFCFSLFVYAFIYDVKAVPYLVQLKYVEQPKLCMTLTYSLTFEIINLSVDQDTLTISIDGSWAQEPLPLPPTPGPFQFHGAVLLKFDKVWCASHPLASNRKSWICHLFLYYFSTLKAEAVRNLRTKYQRKWRWFYKRELIWANSQAPRRTRWSASFFSQLQLLCCWTTILSPQVSELKQQKIKLALLFNVKLGLDTLQGRIQDSPRKGRGNSKISLKIHEMCASLPSPKLQLVKCSWPLLKTLNF